MTANWNYILRVLQHEYLRKRLTERERLDCIEALIKKNKEDNNCMIKNIRLIVNPEVYVNHEKPAGPPAKPSAGRESAGRPSTGEPRQQPPKGRLLRLVKS